MLLDWDISQHYSLHQGFPTTFLDPPNMQTFVHTLICHLSDSMAQWRTELVSHCQQLGLFTISDFAYERLYITSLGYDHMDYKTCVVKAN